MVSIFWFVLVSKLMYDKYNNGMYRNLSSIAKGMNYDILLAKLWQHSIRILVIISCRCSLIHGT